MTLSRKVPGHLVGRPDLPWTRIAAHVVGMGWLSAVGITQHLHRNLLRHAEHLPRHLPRAGEMTRRSGCPLSTTRDSATPWMIYIDNLEVIEAVPNPNLPTDRLVCRFNRPIQRSVRWSFGRFIFGRFVGLNRPKIQTNRPKIQRTDRFPQEPTDCFFNLFFCWL